ncbi:hypothetical protein [Carnobacterium inhibens]|uniref:hypothetical protein n=1 Tax=Carnobacterium inhibens TaxID=147709 RepID=UPI00203D0020|nr:hypothetical protein [Carnobacterium inhibens]MCM3511644.1 hypothetical protein [Carnobacterium inhibens]
MTEDQIKELLPIVKKRLRITFTQIDEDVKDFIEEGGAYLREKAGEIDFSLSSHTLSSIKARGLLKEYCQYAWNGTVAFFGTDYQSEIIALQILVAQEAFSNG